MQICIPFVVHTFLAQLYIRMLLIKKRWKNSTELMFPQILKIEIFRYPQHNNIHANRIYCVVLSKYYALVGSVLNTQLNSFVSIAFVSCDDDDDDDIDKMCALHRFYRVANSIVCPSIHH